MSDDLQEQVNEILAETAEKILRLVGRDDIDVKVPKLSARRTGRVEDSTSDPVLASFLGGPK